MSVATMMELLDSMAREQRGTDPLARLDAKQREQTAATILAALVADENMSGALTRWDGDNPVIERLGMTDKRHVAYAVALADALRAELTKVSP